MNKILVIAVAAVVVAGGVCGAVFLMNSGKGSDDFSFKDCHFDLSGAKSLVIAKDSAVNATSSMASKSYGSAVGAATMTLGAADGYDYSLYKTDDYGHYIKVLLYGNDTTDEEGNAIDFKMIPVSMEISDDGKYVLMGFSKPDALRILDDSLGRHVQASVIYVIVVTSTGKVYQLNEQTEWVSIDSPDKSDFIQFYFGNNYNHPVYSIIGSFDSKIMLKHRDLSSSYSVVYVDNDELIVKEIASKQVLSDLGDKYKVYNGGILLIGEANKDYLVFPDGGLYNYNGDLSVYCNNLCTDITYYDDATKMFASSYTAVKSLNKVTNQLVTETVELTMAQSFELVKNNTCRSELYRETTSTEVTVYVMEDAGHLFKFKLKSDCTVDYTSEGLGRIALPSGMKMGVGNMSNLTPQYGYFKDVLDDSSIIGDYFSGYAQIVNPYTSESIPFIIEDYFIFRGHICESSHATNPLAIEGKTPYLFGDIVISGSTLFKLTNGSIKIFDLKTGPAPDYSILSLTKVNYMDLVNGRIVIEGVTNNGTIMKGALNLDTGQFDVNYSNVLSEVRLVALN